MTTRTELISDPDLVVEHLGAFRRTLLSMLDEPDSATGLARRLGTTRQKVNYHLRTLEGAGFVELVETRQRRGLEERIVRRSVDSLVVDPLAFALGGLDDLDAAGVVGVVTTATDNIRHAATVARSAAGRGENLAAAALDTEVTVASPAAFRDLQREIAEVIARHDSKQGLRVRVSTLMLPVEDPG